MEANVASLDLGIKYNFLLAIQSKEMLTIV